jgi:DNA-3-methyladenine glycosylase
MQEAEAPGDPPWQGTVDAGFFARDALKVARALIGAYLVRHVGRRVRVARIVETEAYRGPTDAACHARVGLTRRTRTLLGPPGRAYVFLIYGMYDCFNVVCLGEGKGHAVLVRGGEPAYGIEPGQRLDGPGRFTRALGITRSDDGKDLRSDELYVAPRARRPRIVTSARVGVAYAGAIAEAPWRFFDGASPHVSRPSKKQIGLGAR